MKIEIVGNLKRVVFEKEKCEMLKVSIDTDSPVKTKRRENVEVTYKEQCQKDSSLYCTGIWRNRGTRGEKTLLKWKNIDHFYGK